MEKKSYIDKILADEKQRQNAKRLAGYNPSFSEKPKEKILIETPKVEKITLDSIKQTTETVNKMLNEGASKPIVRTMGKKGAILDWKIGEYAIGGIIRSIVNIEDKTITVRVLEWPMSVGTRRGDLKKAHIDTAEIVTEKTFPQHPGDVIGRRGKIYSFLGYENDLNKEITTSYYGDEIAKSSIDAYDSMAFKNSSNEVDEEKKEKLNVRIVVPRHDRHDAGAFVRVWEGEGLGENAKWQYVYPHQFGGVMKDYSNKSKYKTTVKVIGDKAFDQLKKTGKATGIMESAIDNVFSIAREYRNDGSAVVMWTPGELKGVSNKNYCKDRMIELGNEVLADMRQGQNTPSGNVPKAIRDAVLKAEKLGYIMLVWTPEELGVGENYKFEVNRNKFEDRVIELGHEVIDDLKESVDEASKSKIRLVGIPSKNTMTIPEKLFEIAKPYVMWNPDDNLWEYDDDEAESLLMDLKKARRK